MILRHRFMIYDQPPLVQIDVSQNMPCRQLCCVLINSVFHRQVTNYSHAVLQSDDKFKCNKALTTKL